MSSDVKCTSRILITSQRDLNSFLFVNKRGKFDLIGSLRKSNYINSDDVVDDVNNLINEMFTYPSGKRFSGYASELFIDTLREEIIENCNEPIEYEIKSHRIDSEPQLVNVYVSEIDSVTFERAEGHLELGRKISTKGDLAVIKLKDLQKERDQCASLATRVIRDNYGVDI